MSLLNTCDQIYNLKLLKLFPPFMSFRLDVKDRRKILAPKSRKDKFKKPMAPFLESKHISIFGRPLWFVYKSSNKLKEVVKWKLLSGRRCAKYDLNNKNHVFIALSFCIVLNVYLKNPVSLLLVQTIVNSHLRMIIIIDQNIGVLYTTTLSKPILALMIIKLLYKKNN